MASHLARPHSSLADFDLTICGLNHFDHMKTHSRCCALVEYLARLTSESRMQIYPSVIKYLNGIFQNSEVTPKVQTLFRNHALIPTTTKGWIQATTETVFPDSLQLEKILGILQGYGISLFSMTIVPKSSLTFPKGCYPFLTKVLGCSKHLLVNQCLTLIGQLAQIKTSDDTPSLVEGLYKLLANSPDFKRSKDTRLRNNKWIYSVGGWKCVSEVVWIDRKEIQYFQEVYAEILKSRNLSGLYSDPAVKQMFCDLGVVSVLSTQDHQEALKKVAEKQDNGDPLSWDGVSKFVEYIYKIIFNTGCNDKTLPVCNRRRKYVFSPHSFFRYGVKPTTNSLMLIRSTWNPTKLNCKLTISSHLHLHQMNTNQI